MKRTKKILVADDNTKLLQALKFRLEANGLEVVLVQDSYQAVDFCRRHKPDLLLLDVNMPAGSGFSVHSRISKIEECQGIPVIYLTGDAQETVDTKAEELGAAAVLRKPVGAELLLRTIWSVLDSTESGRRESEPPIAA